MPGPLTPAARAEARRLLAGLRSLQLATTAPDGVPEASYAPFLLDDGAFHVQLSTLAAHTERLTNAGGTGILLIEDEAAAEEIFARRRLTFTCTAEIVPRGSAEWIRLSDRFEEKFGAPAALIRPLTDFRLFALRPGSGLFVRGFGQAFRIDPAALDTLLQGGPR